MSCLKFGKPLQPARKAWKGLATSIQKKLHKLNRSKAAQKTRNRFSATVTAIARGTSSLSTSHLQKKPTKVRPPSSHHRRHHHHHHHHNHKRRLKQSFAPVYVDELFNEPPIEKLESRIEQSANKIAGKDVATSSNSGGTAFGSEFLPPLPVLPPGVDERAEAFITRFREDMRLQRQRSLRTLRK